MTGYLIAILAGAAALYGLAELYLGWRAARQSERIVARVIGDSDRLEVK